MILNMENRDHKLSSVVLLIFIIFFCLITSFLILFDNYKPSYYNLLWLLPLVYLFFFIILFYMKKIFKYIGIILVASMYGVRMVIVPFVMYLGDYMTYGMEQNYSNNMDSALLLMCYELVFILFFIIITTDKIYGDDESFYHNSNVMLKWEYTQRFKFVLLFLILYMIIIFIGTPGLIKESFFLTTGQSEESAALYYSGEVSHRAFGLSFGKQLVTILFTVFWIIQVVLPPVLLTYMIKKINNKTLRNITFIAVMILTLIICTETRAHSIECAGAFTITTAIFYKNEIKINYKLIIIIIMIVLSLGLSSKSKISTEDDNVLQSISVTLSAYCSGPNNIATAITAVKESGELNILKIIPDVLLQLPYLTLLFRPFFSGTSNTIFNQYVSMISTGQIIPSIGMGYVYFGFLLSPLVPCFAVYCTMKFEKLSKKAPDIIRKNLFILAMIMMSRTTTTSNMLSGVTYLGHVFMTWGIIVFCYSKLTNQKTIK